MAHNDIAFGSIFSERDQLDVDYLDIPAKKKKINPYYVAYSYHLGYICSPKELANLMQNIVNWLFVFKQIKHADSSIFLLSMQLHQRHVASGSQISVHTTNTHTDTYTHMYQWTHGQMADDRGKNIWGGCF